MYYLLLAAIALILIIIAICVSYQVIPQPILTADFLLSIDTSTLREHALTPFASLSLDDIIHKRNPLGMYNMSVRKTTDGYSGVIRGSSCDGCRSANPQPLFSYSYYISLNHNGDVLEINLINLDYNSMTSCKDIFLANGFEDSKLFIFKGEEWVVGNVMGSVKQQNACINTICIFKVSDPRNSLMLLSPPPEFDQKQRQKNWAPFEYNDELYCEYSVEPHVILKINHKTGETSQEFSTGQSKVNIISDKSLRSGGCPILINHKGKNYYMNIAHAKTSWPFDYTHLFYVFQAEPPFKIIAMTDLYKLDYKARIQFAAGISEYENNIHVSYGIEDCDNRIAVYEKDRLMDLMHFPNEISPLTPSVDNLNLLDPLNMFGISSISNT